MPRMTWRRANPPLSAPAISGISSAEASTTAWDISWAVSPSSSGEVRYGTTSGSYPLVTTRQVAPLPAHLQRLSSLTPGTVYYYIVWARDPITGLENTSGEGTFTTSGAVALDYPPAIPLVFLAKPVQAPPNAGQVITDPQYGTEVTKVNGVGPKVRYASKSFWNCNQTLALADGTSGARALLNGQDLTVINPNITTDGAWTWDPVEPYSAWTYSNPNIVRKRTVNPLTGAVSTASQVALTQYSAIVLGGNQGSPDNLGRYLALKAVKPSGAAVVAVFSTQTMAVIAEVTIASSGTINTTDACGISQSGEHVSVVNSAPGTGVSQGTWSYKIDLATGTRRFLTTGGDHWDTGLLEDGVTDVHVACNQSLAGGVEQGGSSGFVGMYRMDTGAYTPLKQYWLNGVVSCRNIDRPGYCLISSYTASSSNPTFAGWSTLPMIRFSDPPYAGGDVENFGNYHGTLTTDYANQTNACLSPDGTRAVVNAGWDGSATQIYAFGMDVIR